MTKNTALYTASMNNTGNNSIIDKNQIDKLFKRDNATATHPSSPAFVNSLLDGLTVTRKKKIPNIIISDFRSDAGEVADVLSFQKEFLRRELSDLQKDAYLAAWGEKGGEWSTKYNEIVLLVGMKGGKNFWMEGDAAYLCYYVSMLRDPHQYFTKITGRKIPYQLSCNFDVPFVTAVDENQSKYVTFNGILKVIKRTFDPKNNSDNWFEKYTGLDLRTKYGDLLKTEIIFPEIKPNSGIGGLRLFAFNSNPASPEGYHMLRFYTDELSRADTKISNNGASKSLDLGLFNTTASFPNRVGKVIEVSYPNASKYDVTWERYQASLKIDSIYGLKAASYEFNPCLTKDQLGIRDQESAEYKLKYECIKIDKAVNKIRKATDK